MRGKATPIIILFIICCLQTYGQHNSCWELAIEKNDVEVFVHHSNDTRIRGFKAVTTLSIPFDSVETIFDNIAEYPNWQSTVKSAKIMHEVSDMKYHFETRTSLPWPSKNQDLMWRAEKEWDKREGSLVYNQVCSTNTMPDKVRNSSVIQAFASWRLTPVSESEVKITYYLTVDQGGKIPSWIINMLNPDAPYETLSNLQGMTLSSADQIALD